MAIPWAPPVFARLSFFVSGTWAAIVGLMWLVDTPESTGWRVAAGMALGAFVFVLVPQMVRLTYAQTPPSQGANMSDSSGKPPSPAGTGNITTTNQSGGINNTGNMTVNQEDRSPKRRLKDLFNMVDPRILATVSQGQTQLRVRMQPFEIDRLQALIAESGPNPTVTVTGYGSTFIDSMINNGSLGTSQAVHEQRQVLLAINPAILQ
jgi:hypothetical protein